ncbi:hypothetical protein [Sphingomonas sp. VNH70]|uniref:hypothetical protein n=1 Tax=Sphingomonas silueang TaxID=3156617 RepID=UPI0032B51229
MRPNPGHLPQDAIGKRVRVLLANGREGSTDPNPMTPSGWAADGKNGCRWSLTGSPFDIAEYEVIA